MQFNKGDRVSVRESIEWIEAGEIGTVVRCDGGAVQVALDSARQVPWWVSLSEIEKVEEAKPTDSIQVDNVVNHPPHYTGFSNGAEVIDITENLPFNRGSAIKYLARAGKKNPDRELEDLKKALWFVAREIERLEKSEKKEEK